jgi:2-dehydro-3-deoxyglucarate aldolase/4-hydroxy-2-oxoheptanedioate aldolase
MPAAIDNFRKAIASGRTLIGPAVSFADPLVTDALAPSADFIWLDLEHALMSPEAVSAHLLAGRARGVPMIVRVPGGDTHTVKPVLDAGAEAVVIPQVRTLDEVRRFVADCYYPPEGIRGYGPRVPTNYGRTGGAAFAEDANRTIMPTIMIETREAFEQLDAILAVPGVGAIMIGPTDLSWSLGLRGQTAHPDNLAAVQSIAQRVRAKGLPVGAGMGVEPDFAVTLAGLGVQWLQVGADFAYLHTLLAQLAAGIRSKLPAS